VRIGKESVLTPQRPTAESSEPEARRGSNHLLEKIVRLSLSASAIDIAEHEQAEAERLRAELVPSVRELITDALDFFERILDTYGADEDPEPAAGEGEAAPIGSFRREVDELLHGEIRGERIADLAFIGRL
jgi:uncharacterized protein YnzC (UPF0291/DUF896 family)